MNVKEKITFGVLGTLIFIVSGGVACTYSTTQAVNPVLAAILGILVFVTAGATACTYSNSKIAKQSENKIAQ
jgi:hypothetical protein